MNVSTEVNASAVDLGETGEYVYLYDFHYRFEKELKMTYDENSEPTECLSRVTISSKKPIDETTLEEWHQSKAFLVHNFTKEQWSHVIPISKEEYEDTISVK